MNTFQKYFAFVVIGILFVLSAEAATVKEVPVKVTPTFTSAVVTPTVGKVTRTPTSVVPPTITNTPIIDTATATNTPTVTPTTVGGLIAPYPNAPTCPDVGASHDNSKFHTLWDAVRGCHYLNEHGQNPFTPDVTAAFPDFDLRALLGGVEIGHTDPSSPAENTTKHGGFKWAVDLSAPAGCTLGFESGQVAVDAYAIQIHFFGRSNLELETPNHSTAALLRQCKSDNPNDKGYVYLVQLQEFGQRVVPYQGPTVLPYPNTFVPAYDASKGPYIAVDCINTGMLNCGKHSLAQLFASNGTLGTADIWTSKPSGPGLNERPETSKLFRLLMTSSANYQLLDSTDGVYPFTWGFICGNASYNPVGCRYNNAKTEVNEIAGNIPAAWDNLSGFDSDSRIGRITATGFVTKYGDLNTSCTQADPSLNCYPIKMVNAFVGFYSSEVNSIKASRTYPVLDRNIYFCNGIVCNGSDAGAVPSGWIGPDN